MNTNYKDKNGKEIMLGHTVNIHANPYHGEYEVKFGRYRLKPDMKHQIEVPHLGFYLTNGKNIVSLMHVLEQPTGYGSSTHSIEVINTSQPEPPIFGGERKDDYTDKFICDDNCK